MKKWLAIAAAAIFAVSASATPLCGTGMDVLVPGFACELGPLTFSNFWANPVPGPITIGYAGIVGSEAILSFNPGFLQGPYDFWFGFNVTGPHKGIDVDLTTGSSNSGIEETVCAVPLGPGGSCPQNQILAQLTVFSGQRGDAAYLAMASAGYIFKDVGVGRDGSLSRFSQSFHIVPEPMTLLLIGSGLLGLGLLRRRIAK